MDFIGLLFLCFQSAEGRWIDQYIRSRTIDENGKEIVGIIMPGIPRRMATVNRLPFRHEAQYC
jgi:hypothetical protein